MINPKYGPFLLISLIMATDLCLPFGDPNAGSRNKDRRAAKTKVFAAILDLNNGLSLREVWLLILF